VKSSKINNSMVKTAIMLADDRVRGVMGPNTHSIADEIANAIGTIVKTTTGNNAALKSLFTISKA
jgi:hypothetical protein